MRRLGTNGEGKSRGHLADMDGQETGKFAIFPGVVATHWQGLRDSCLGHDTYFKKHWVKQKSKVVLVVVVTG